ncbi:MAG: hypothetical protein JXA04_05960 [Gammaproteobacteria bacterium]|nr:hypothetical protein [Gammaproteobacteria bacterium]
MKEIPVQVYIAVAAFLVLGLSLAWMGFRRLFSRRLLSGGTNLVIGLLLLAVTVATVGAVANLYTYLQLTAEQLVGTIEFQKYANQEYIAKLTRADGDIKRYTIFGDECQMDARILKWNGSAHLLGFNTLYRLERISSRYSETAQAETARRSVHPLAEHAGIEIWDIVNRFDNWLPWVDAFYGNAVYVPMQDGARYMISVSISGLIARPQNIEARRAIKDWK